MKCKNCDQKVDGDFCGHCGQSIKVGKINYTNLLSELSNDVFQVNKGLFYTMKALFVRPGQSIKEYLNGKRKNHFKPIAYALTISTIYFLLSQFTDSDTFVNDFITGFTNKQEDSNSDSNQIVTLNWFAKNFTYTMLMLLPMFSWASFIAFRRSGFNYLEHFVLNAYIAGQQAIVYSLFAVLTLTGINDSFLATTATYVSVFYLFIVFWQFFSEQSRVRVVFRTILTYVLFLFMLSLVLTVIFVAVKISQEG